MAGKQAPWGRAAADSTNRPPPCVAAMSEANCRNLHLAEQADKIDEMQTWRKLQNAQQQPDGLDHCCVSLDEEHVFQHDSL